MSACTCNPPHPRSDHRNGVGRCTRPGCSCLYGPPPARRTALPRPSEHGVGHVDANGLVQDFKRVVRESERTKLERSLWRRIEEAGLPMPDELEYRWARTEGRMYRSDGFYRLPIPTLIEVDGGTWIGGGHSRGSGLEHDRRRDNLAALLGYRVLRFTKQMIRDGTAVLTIRRALTSTALGEVQQPLPTYNEALRRTRSSGVASTLDRGIKGA